MICKTCKHPASSHFSLGEQVCLNPGCFCRKYEPVEEVLPTMFAVRIDKNGESYTFKVEPMAYGPELVALDSAPGVIAFVEAPDPGAAALRAWEKGYRELASLNGLPASSPEELLQLLGDKKPE